MQFLLSLGFRSRAFTRLQNISLYLLGLTQRFDIKER